jgi:dTDP-4-dehydrorhamnose reductase
VRILVTGAGGQVGEALLKTAPEGREVVGLTRAQLDITDRTAVLAAVYEHKPEVIFNCAAYNAVDRAESEQDRAFAVNHAAVATLAAAAEDADALFVHISSDYVFDGNADAAYRPGDPANPLSIYGRSKLLGENAALGYDTSLEALALVVRTSWVHAAGHANFVTTMLRLMRERDELSVVSDQVSAPTWATGLARTLWELAEKGATGICHHRDAGQASWHEFAVAIGEEAEALGLIERQIPIHPVSTDEFGAVAPRPHFSLLDDSITRDLLGDTAPHWRKNLRTMLCEVLLEEEAARG